MRVNSGEPLSDILRVGQGGVLFNGTAAKHPAGSLDCPMRLSAETYDQIIGSLRSDKNTSKDKRREPRVGVSGDGELVDLNQPIKRHPHLLRIRDISKSGVGLVSSRELIKQQDFTIALYNENQEPVWLMCKAAYCKKIDGGFFSVGALIHQVLRGEAVAKILADAAQTAAKAAESERAMLAALEASKVKAAKVARDQQEAVRAKPTVTEKAAASASKPVAVKPRPQTDQEDIDRISKAILG